MTSVSVMIFKCIGLVFRTANLSVITPWYSDDISSILICIPLGTETLAFMKSTKRKNRTITNIERRAFFQILYFRECLQYGCNYGLENPLGLFRLELGRFKVNNF